MSKTHPPAASRPVDEAILADVAVNARRPAPPRRKSTGTSLDTITSVNAESRAKRHHRHHHSWLDLFDTRSSNPMVSPEEYEALPTSIQKKYFSSVERLRIAQAAAAVKRKRQNTQKKCVDAPSSTVPHPAQPLKSQPRPKARRPSTRPCSVPVVFDDTSLSVDQALWFLNLPEKAKRQQFSKEEQAALTKRCRSVLKYFGIEVAQDRQAAVPQKRPVGSSAGLVLVRSLTAEGRVTGNDNDEKDDNDNELGMDALRKYFRRHSLRKDKVEPEDLPSAPLPPPPEPVVVPRDRTFRSFKRNFTLKPINLPPPTLAPEPYLPSPTTLKYFPHLTQSKHSSDPARPATHYQDPSAREKLRQLSAPHKFEEAVHFGFQSTTHSKPGSSSSETEHASHMRSRPGRDSCTSDSESLETRGPATPTGSAHHDWEPALAADSDTSLPLHKDSVESKRHDSHSMLRNAEREMTLRLTLTRPELRESEKEAIDWQLKNYPPYAAVKSLPPSVPADPLALERLPVCDDSTGARGAFAVKEKKSGGGKAFKTLRLR